MSDLLTQLGNDQRKLRLLEWLLTPPSDREPATKTALADELGVTARTLRNWESDARFVRLLREETIRVSGGVERAKILLDQLFADATNENNSATERTRAATEFLKVTKAISPEDQAPRENSLAGMPMGELLELYKETIRAELRSHGVDPVDVEAQVLAEAS